MLKTARSGLEDPGTTSGLNVIGFELDRSGPTLSIPQRFRLEQGSFGHRNQVSGSTIKEGEVSESVSGSSILELKPGLGGNVCFMKPGRFLF